MITCLDTSLNSSTPYCENNIAWAEFKYISQANLTIMHIQKQTASLIKKLFLEMHFYKITISISRSDFLLLLLFHKLILLKLHMLSFFPLDKRHIVVENKWLYSAESSISIFSYSFEGVIYYEWQFISRYKYK